MQTFGRIDSGKEIGQEGTNWQWTIFANWRTTRQYRQGRNYHWCSRCKAPGPTTCRGPLRPLN